MKLDIAIFGALIIIAASGILAGDDLTIDYFYEVEKQFNKTFSVNSEMR